MSNSQSDQHEGFCLSGAESLVNQGKGILNAEVSSDHHSLTLDYDPARISQEEIQKVAQRIGTEPVRNYERCLLRLDGRGCEACALKLESKAEKIPGVRRATATYLGGTMTVTFDSRELPDSSVVEAVKQIGAKVRPYAEEEQSTGKVESIFTALTLILMATAFFGSKSGMTSASVILLYAGAYITGGCFGVLASIESLKQRTVDVDLLMVLAAIGAACVGAPLEGAMLLFLFSLSNVLQDFAIARTRKAIKSLMKLRPSQALVKRGEETVMTPIEQVALDDVIVVRPGERMPLDGAVIEGRTSIDESSITGESLPVSKAPGASVFAGTINQTGAIEVRVTKLAQDSTIARLIQMVEVAQSEKAQTQRWLDRAEQYYASGVIALTIALIVIPWAMGTGTFAEIFYRAMTVMVVASPCALVISTPATILSAIGGAARRGVLFKGGAHLERAATIKTVVFDKTGTLTEGKPRVTDVAGDEPDLLALVASVETRSEHPLAQAIVNDAKDKGLTLYPCTDFQSVSGQGASGLVNGRRIAAGNARYLASFGLPEPQETFSAEGKTTVFVAEVTQEPAKFLGMVAIADVLRADAAEAIRSLKKQGVERVIMLTGDNRHVAAAIARQAGVDEFHAELRPEDKLALVKQMKAAQPVAMVGDGVNDAPALAAATVGIAMGAAGTDVAMETADVVLMNNQLSNVAFALGLSRNARRVVIQNLSFALGVIVVLIASALGLHLPLTLGVVGHEGSTVLVCLNGLRLLLPGTKI